MGSQKIPHSFIEKLLSEVDIVEVISHYIPLSPAGRNFKALCPFHAEKTPSFYVSPDKQIFKCFGCGVGGNAITFIEKYEGVSFKEALKRLCDISGIPLPEEVEQEEDYEILEKVALFFKSKIGAVADYLKNKRKVSEEIAQRFLLGYAPKGYSKALPLSKEEQKALGLLSQKGAEMFSNRLIIPIRSSVGRVIAFAGRSLDGTEPKYINSPETDYFKKSKTLFGLFESKEKIIKSRKVFLVEGYFDVIAMHAAGYLNAVAPMGTSLTKEQVKILKRYADTVVLLFDSDRAGKRATARAAGMLLSSGFDVKAVLLPDSEDPDSYLREKASLPEEIDILKWFSEALKTSEEDEKIYLLKAFSENVSQLKLINPFRFERIRSEILAEFGADIAIFAPKARVETPREEHQKKPLPPREKAFIRGLADGLVSERVVNVLSPLIFESEELASAFSLFKALGSFEMILTERENLREVLTEALMEEFKEDEIEKAQVALLIKEIGRRIKTIKKQDVKRRSELKKLEIKLRRGELGADAAALKLIEEVSLGQTVN